MLTLGSIIGLFVGRLPALAALITGLVLIGTNSRRLPPRSVRFARAGLIIMLVQLVLSTIFVYELPRLMLRASGYSYRQFDLYYGVGNLFFEIIFATGLVLVLAGLIAARRPQDPSSFPAYPQYSQPQYPQQQYPPQQQPGQQGFPQQPPFPQPPQDPPAYGQQPGYPPQPPQS